MTTSEKDRESTEKRLLEAVGQLIEESGLEFLGVNAVAHKAGVSKMLIYRYFGSLEELIARYIMQRDYWVNIPADILPGEDIKTFVKGLFGQQIRQLREDKLLIRLYRWELSARNPLVGEIRKRREENGIRLIEFVNKVTGIPYSEIQILATLISSTITYLAMFADTCDTYNGLPIQTGKGWEQLEAGIHLLIDKWM
ncbi:MAG: TetR/AcrR family transcriptional regulator [Bacteroides sp.]|nr:TetR/AcrR family transcriptional regulator [Bacteroides sp.]